MSREEGLELRMKSVSVALLQLLLVVSFVGAAVPDGFRQEFQGPVDAWMNSEMESAVLFEKMNRLDTILTQGASSWESLYWQSRTAYVRGQIHYEREDKESSLAELERSRELAEDSISIFESSDSWRIMAESSSLIMLQRGFAYIILNFQKGQNQAKRSLELDPGNARASHVIAQFLCAAPRIAGGNMREGIESLQTLSVRPDLIEEDRFILLLTLSEVLQREDRIDESIAACRDALSIYPGNGRARALLRNLLS